MGQAASDGSPVADRDVPDLRGGLADEGGKPARGGQLRCAVPDQRPDTDAAVGGIDRLKRADPVDVDQDRGPGQAEGEQREQALAAR